MSEWPAIVVGAAIAVTFATIVGYIVRRRRLQESTTLGDKTPSGHRGHNPRPEGGEVRLGQRLESWTRPPTVLQPTHARSAKPPQASSVPTNRPASEPVGVDPASAGVGEERLISPVELWFGGTRVGVVPGSDTHKEFERYAEQLLSELNEG
jgi:hypothetical protein